MIRHDPDAFSVVPVRGGRVGKAGRRGMGMDNVEITFKITGQPSRKRCSEECPPERHPHNPHITKILFGRKRPVEPRCQNCDLIAPLCHLFRYVPHKRFHSTVMRGIVWRHLHYLQISGTSPMTSFHQSSNMKQIFQLRMRFNCIQIGLTDILPRINSWGSR